MRKSRWFVLALALGMGLGLLVILLIVPQAGLAQPGRAVPGLKDNSNPVLGPFINVYDGAYDDGDAAVVYNSLHDEYLVVWSSYLVTSRNIYARRVSADGALGSVSSVSLGNYDLDPAVAYSPAHDEYLIVYTRIIDGYEPADYDIFARRLSWDGLWMSSEFTITQAVDVQMQPAVAYNDQDDEYLVVYTNKWAGGLYDLYAQRVEASTGALLSWSTVASGDGNREASSVAYDTASHEGHGGYLIAYTHLHTDTLKREIRAKLSTPDLAGLFWDIPEVVICDTGNDQNQVAVAAGVEEYLAIWLETVSTAPYDAKIRGRKMGADGTLLGEDSGFDIGGIADDVFIDGPALAYGAGYGYLAVWQYDNSSPYNEEQHGRYVMGGHDAPVGEVFLIDGNPLGQYGAAVACAPSGDCLVVDSWTGNSWDIGGRFVGPQRVYLPLALQNH